jgi:hypothetical protein
MSTSGTPALTTASAGTRESGGVKPDPIHGEVTNECRRHLRSRNRRARTCAKRTFSLGKREIVTKLADARLTEKVMTVFGAGHGRIDPPLALVGLLLAVTGAVRYGQGGQCVGKVTIVVFKKDAHIPAQADRVVVRGALAFIGSRD